MTETTQSAAQNRRLGIDFGQQRIGVAVSEGRVAVPLLIIEHERRDADLARVAQIAREREASAVIVGLPIGLSGEEGEQARRTRRFGDALARRLDVPVIYQDERMSSVQVRGAAGGRISGGSTARNSDRRAMPRVDDLAAAVILQAYLDAQESGS